MPSIVAVAVECAKAAKQGRTQQARVVALVTDSGWRGVGRDGKEVGWGRREGRKEGGKEGKSEREAAGGGGGGGE